MASHLLTSALAAAQPNAPPPKPAAPILPGNSSIAGRVVEQATDQGVAGAIVTLESVDRARRSSRQPTSTAATRSHASPPAIIESPPPIRAT